MWRRTFILLAGVSLLMLILGFGAVFWQWKDLKQYLSRFSWDQSIRIYSRPLSLFPESYVLNSPEFFRSELLSYGYREVKELLPSEPQTFSITSDQVCVIPTQTSEELPALSFIRDPVCVKWDDPGVSLWTQNAQGASEISQAHLPPLLVGFLFAQADRYEVRSVIRLDEIPSELMWSVIAVEDERFFVHQGVDLKSIARAFFANVKSGRIVQGGSTITQQLIKNMVLTQEKTLWRKFREAVLAYLMETVVSKDEILVTYFNEIYFGSRGKMSIHGVKEAAYYYFGKSPTALTLAECATLAAMIRNPGYYAQTKHAAALRHRRNMILDRLETHRYATPSEVHQAKQSDLALRRKEFLDQKVYGYWLDALRLKIPFEKLQTHSGLLTSIDPLIQLQTVYAVRSVLDQLRGQEHWAQKTDQKFQGAFLVVLPKTGEILAMQGGYDYGETQFNRALEAKRQVGSVIKPFVYGAAFELDENLSPLTPVLDLPFELQARPDETWKPKNYEEKYYHWVTLRQALENSLNVATIKVALHVGLDRVSEVFKQLWPDLHAFYPSSVVGSMTMSLDQLLARYQLFYHCDQKVILSLHWREGQAREVVNNPFSCDVLAQVGTLLQGVVSRGTAKSLNVYLKEKVGMFMGKTGTTNEGHDAWFVGMESRLLAGGWIGFDQLQESKLTGAGGALPLFGVWMRSMIQQGYDPTPLMIPHHLQEYAVETTLYERNDITRLLPTPDREWIHGRLTSEVFKTKIE